VKRTTLLLIVILFVTFSGCIIDISEETPAPTISVFGIVLEKASELPLSGVKITIGDRETATNAIGAYAISNLTKGVQRISAQIDGYASFDIEVYILNDETEIHIELETYSAYCNRVKSVYDQGNTYNTVLIGNQCWFRENLNIGTQIHYDQQQTNNTVIEKYCLDDLTENCTKWGGLYQWDEAMNHIPTHSIQGICPDGWHVPAFSEFKTLGAAVNEDGNALKGEGEGNNDGDHPEGVGTNTSGWTALLGGAISSDKGSMYSAQPGFPRFWSSEEADASTARNFGLFEWVGNTFYDEHDKRNGFNIRCLKD
jgi:uncharacterized protein (TIGR02145 family)